MQGRLAIDFYSVGIEGTTSRETSKLGQECPLVGLCVLTLEGSHCHKKKEGLLAASMDARDYIYGFRRKGLDTAA